MSRVLPRLRGRLLTRVFLHGVALVVVSALTVVFVVVAIVSPSFDASAVDFGTAVAPALCARLQGSAELRAGPRAVPATLFREDGTVVASLATPALEPLRQPELDELRRVGFVQLRGPAVAAFRCDGSEQYVVLGHPVGAVPLAPIAAAVFVILIVVSLGSFPLARSLVAPIGELLEATQRIGRGDLTTRVASGRADEIGDLGRAFDDMTERLQALVAAEKELLANVSHELRTPLARIRVVLETAEESPARAQTLLAQIGIDLADLERLVEDVMDAMRLDVGANTLGRAQLPLRLEPTNLEALVDTEVERQRALHPGRTFDARLGGEDLEIGGDPRLLRRVIDNLLQNAVKYSTDEEPIEIRVARVNGRQVELSVSDHGVGISAEDLPNIFRPFFRGDKSRTRGTGGAGLGLALSKRICEVHGGTIEAESTLGKGTTVRVVLPIDPTPDSRAQK